MRTEIEESKKEDQCVEDNEEQLGSMKEQTLPDDSDKNISIFDPG
jgi:hypothetical protein